MGVVAFKRDPDVPHMTGAAICGACQHEWIAVAPIGETLLECPQCHTIKGRMKHACGPLAGDIWICHCGNDLFRITTKAAMCINCGREQAF